MAAAASPSPRSDIIAPMLTLTYDNERGGDIALADLLARADEPITPERQIEEAVIFALMTDARADESEIRTGDDPRGYWANPEVGSLIWLYRRAVLNDQTLQRIESAATAALAKIPLEVDSVSAERASDNPNAVILSVTAAQQQIQIAL